MKKLLYMLHYLISLKRLIMTRAVEHSPRSAALSVLDRVDGGAYADIVLDKELKGFSPSDAGLATEIVYGVLRWRIKLDWTIDSFSTMKTSRLERSVLNALRIGVYQLLFLTRVPASAAINESVNLVKSGGKRKAGFVNAVLRKVDSSRGLKPVAPGPPGPNNPALKFSIEFSHPEWLVRRWIERFGAKEAEELCKANLVPPPKTLRANTMLVTRDSLIRGLAAEGVHAVKTAFSPVGVQVVNGSVDARDRRFYIQDEASQLVPLLLAPAPGETVLDACSAPGGKATHMAALMKNEGRLYALEKYPGRLKAVTEAAGRLGISIIETLAADSTEPLPLDPAIAFDAILCDAPCSGLGVIGRSPDIKYRRTELDLLENAERQKRLLSNLAGYLKPGGRMVYSVCSFEPEETVNVVTDFLKQRADFVLESAGGYVPEECRTLVDEPGFFRTYPHRHGVDGFFAARLKKLP